MASKSDNALPEAEAVATEAVYIDTHNSDYSAAEQEERADENHNQEKAQEQQPRRRNDTCCACSTPSCTFHGDDGECCAIIVGCHISFCIDCTCRQISSRCAGCGNCNLSNFHTCCGDWRGNCNLSTFHTCCGDLFHLVRAPCSSLGEACQSVGSFASSFCSSCKGVANDIFDLNCACNSCSSCDCDCNCNCCDNLNLNIN